MRRQRKLRKELRCIDLSCNVQHLAFIAEFWGAKREGWAQRRRLHYTYLPSTTHDGSQTPAWTHVGIIGFAANVAIPSRSRHLRPLLQRQQSADITVELHHHGRVDKARLSEPGYVKALVECDGTKTLQDVSTTTVSRDQRSRRNFRKCTYRAGPPRKIITEGWSSQPKWEAFLKMSIIREVRRGISSKRLGASRS